MAIRSGEDRAWVRSAIAGPIRQAVEHALDRLVDELIDELALGRPDLVARILGASPEVWPGGQPRSRPVRVPVMAQGRPDGASETLPLWAEAASPAAPDAPDPPAGDGIPARVAVLR